MKQDTMCNAVNVLYYLYFENRELVHFYERVWTEDGMRYVDEEYAYIFCGALNPRFPIDLDIYNFFVQSKIVEASSGNEHENNFTLTAAHRKTLLKILKEKNIKTVAE